MSLMMLHKVSANASRAGQTAVADQETVTKLSHELAQVQARISIVQERVSVPAPVFHLPAGLQHYGICLTRTTNNATGDLANVTLMTPVVQAGSYTCPAGNLVSVVPAP
jgi:hypothetical protein